MPSRAPAIPWPVRARTTWRASLSAIFPKSTNHPARKTRAKTVPGVPSMPAAATIIRHPAAVSPNEAFQVNLDLQTRASMS